MPTRHLLFLLPVLLLAAPRHAPAARLSEGPCGPPVATLQNGFIETPGPGAYAPEHAGDFKPPGPADACPPTASAATTSEQTNPVAVPQR